MTMNRKSLRIALFSIAILIMCAGYVNGASNLLVNPSFEEVDKYGAPTGWKIYSSSSMSAGALITNDVAVSGKSSFLCSINYPFTGKLEAVLLQQIPVEKNKVYKVGLKYRKENFGGTGPYTYTTIQIWDKDEQNIIYIEPLIMLEHNKIDDQLLFWQDEGFRVVLKDKGSNIGEGEWVDHWVVIKTNEDTAFIYIVVGITVKNPDTTWKMYFDDIYIEEVR